MYDVLDDWVIVLDGAATPAAANDRLQEFRARLTRSGLDAATGWVDNSFIVPDLDHRGEWLVIVDAAGGYASQEEVATDLNRAVKLSYGSRLAGTLLTPLLLNSRIQCYSRERFTLLYGSPRVADKEPLDSRGRQRCDGRSTDIQTRWRDIVYRLW